VEDDDVGLDAEVAELADLLFEMLERLGVGPVEVALAVGVDKERPSAARCC
jgi:hypothetical protein